MGLHCTELFSVILPLSQHDLNKVERDVKQQTIIVNIMGIIHILTWDIGRLLNRNLEQNRINELGFGSF